MAKRLIKQKKTQLNLLEFNVLDKSNSVDNFQDIIIPMNSIQSSRCHSTFATINDINDDSNLNELLYKINSLLENDTMKETNKKKLGPVIKTLPKINTKLRVAFKNLSRLSGQELFNSINSNDKYESSKFLNEKWNSYLSQGKGLKQTVHTNR